MRCPQEQYWMLFYYGDLDESKKKALEAHRSICKNCQAHYARLGDFLSRVKGQRLTLDERELHDIVEKAKKGPKVYGNILVYLKERLDALFERVQWFVSYQPQMAAVTLLVIVGLAIAPFTLGRGMRLAEADIAAIEVELTIEESDNNNLLSDIISFDSFSKTPSFSPVA